MSRFVTVASLETDDILAEIFREFVFWADDDILHCGDGPWVLSHVCRSWRKITLTHPEVWSTIHLEDPDFDSLGVINARWDDADDDLEDTSQRLFDLLNLALARSQNVPLNVKLNVSSTDDESGLSVRLIRAVVAHSNRWKSADLTITTDNLPLFAPIRNRLSLLTELTLGSTTLGVFAQPFPFTNNAPRLERVDLNGFHHRITSLPWRSIRHFSEMHIFRSPPSATESYLNLLRTNPELESVELTYSSRASSPQSSVTHRSLRRLVTSEPDILRHLNLPKLEELVVSEPKDGTFAAIASLLQRSRCSLRSLHLAGFALVDKEALAIFGSCNQSLRELTLVSTGYDEHVKTILELLMRKLHDTSFLSSLEVLKIIISRDYDEMRPMKKPYAISFIDDTFVDMVVARWDRRLTANSGPHLKRVFVLVELPSTVGLSKSRGVEHLRRMGDEGLDVFVRARDPRGLDFEQDAKDISYVYDV
ncbi:hypothetical protein R3P38DRAFT_3219736 [Favolaschia claudopus]|uniref:F-box domain-containing protein n=1 Tax=Favolaschia claudopus TaxID=2862362 RepID=A0AAW0A2F1_9AGAR